MPKIAVYGTLRKNFGNHKFFLEGKSIFLGKSFIEEETEDYFLSPVMDIVNEKYAVVELYEVSDEVKQSIDLFELGFGYETRNKEFFIMTKSHYCDFYVIPKKNGYKNS